MWQMAKEYVRNVDYIKHITKYHQPLILQQGNENIVLTKPAPVANVRTSNAQHTLESTTQILTGDVNWTEFLKKDSELSDNDSDSEPRITTAVIKPKKIIGVNADKTYTQKITTSTNTSPLGLLNLGHRDTHLVTTHEIPEEATTLLKVHRQPCTQIGCVPLVCHKSHTIQTEEPSCKTCLYEEHLILQRQNYIRQDAINNLNQNYREPTTSREDRHRMPLPHTIAYKKWSEKLKLQLKPKSLLEFPKEARSPIFTKTELKITTKEQKPTHSGIRRPSSLTIDNQTYEAICSRKKTRPTLVTSPRKLILPPPPPNGN